MIFCISQVLDRSVTKEIRRALSGDDLFEDGKKTAGKQARTVKANLQGKREHPLVQTACDQVKQALAQNDVFKSAAMPLKWARLLISRCEPGMYYGPHIDNPRIDSVRTDISFTVFLSPPGDYDGGALVIDRVDGEEEVKLEEGSVVVYPSSSLHHVQEVTSGTRLAAVGWIQSQVRSPEKRELLFGLSRSVTQLRQDGVTSSAVTEVARVHANLVRMWAD